MPLSSAGELQQTSNRSKAHVTRDSIGAATWKVNVQRVIK